MRIEHLVIGLAIFGFVIVTFASLYSDTLTNYGIDGDDTIFNELEIDKDVSTNESLDFLSSIQSDTIETEETEGALYKDQIPAARKRVSGLTLLQKTGNTLVEETGIIDNSVLILLFTISTVVFSAMIFYLFWRYKPPRSD